MEIETTVSLPNRQEMFNAEGKLEHQHTPQTKPEEMGGRLQTKQERDRVRRQQVISEQQESRLQVRRMKDSVRRVQEPTEQREF